MRVFQGHRFRHFLLLVLLANLALAQPLYSLLGEQAEFLVAHALDRGQLIALAAILSLVIPALVASIPLAVARLGPSLERETFYLLFIVLGTIVFLPVARAAELDGVLAFGLPALAATAVAAIYWRYDAVRLFFAYLSPAILAFPLYFLLLSRAAGIVLPAGVVGAAAGTVHSSDKDIVFLVLDEFPLVSLLTPDLEIDAERFPNFARLAGMAHWFPGASSGAEGTVIAVPSALTGLPPGAVQGRLPLLTNFPDNLFTRFRFSHEIRAFETSTRLCPASVCDRRDPSATEASLTRDLWLVWLHIVTPSPWSDRLPSIAHAWSGFGRQPAYPEAPGLERALAVAEWARQMDWSQRTQQFQRFIRELEPGAGPQLHYLHTLLPHAPWNHLPDGRQYAFGEANLAQGMLQDDQGVRRWPPNTWLVEQAWQRHLLQVQYLDTLLGALLDRLETTQMLDRALLVVMGDHGAAFVPGEPFRETNPRTLTDITAVPLFLKAPGQRRGARHDIDARLQDVLATLLDALGLPHAGRSLLDPEAQETRGPVEIHGRSGLVAEYGFDEHMAHLRQRATAKAALFGSGARGDIYDIGPERALHGLPVPPDVRPSELVQVAFAGRNLYLNVDPGAAFSPRLVRGEIRGLDPDSNQVIAVAVNGVIETTTRVYAGHFNALLGPAALQAGLNTLEAYLVPPSGRLAGLRRLPQVSLPAFTLSGEAGDTAIMAADGVAVPVRPGSTGLVDIVPAEGNSLYYLAGNFEPGQHLPDRVLAFIGAALGGLGEVDPVTRAFSIPIPARAVMSHARLRVFALRIDAGEAHEMPFGDQCIEDWGSAPPAIQRVLDCAIEAETPLLRDNGGWAGVIAFNDPAMAGLLGRGWGTAGPGSRWSIGKSATLSIPLPPDVTALEFSAHVKPFLAPPELSAQQVWLLANGRPVASWVLSADRFGEIEWIVTAELLALSPERLELRLVTPDAQAPQALGAGSDLRELGLAFTTLTMTSVPESEP